MEQTFNGVWCHSTVQRDICHIQKFDIVLERTWRTLACSLTMLKTPVNREKNSTEKLAKLEK